MTQDEKEGVRKALRRIESSKTFGGVPHYLECLKFVVEKTLTGSTKDELAASKLAIILFDGAKKSNVAPEFGRIREKLLQYYSIEAPLDPVRIEIPRGAYVPKFRFEPTPSADFDKETPESRTQASSVSSMESQPQLWNIPPRNKFFTARDEYLDSVRVGLCKGDGPVAISGLAGVGKTQAAIEYAHRYRDQYALGFWIPSESRDSLVSAYLSVANLLELPDREQSDARLIADAVRRWLTTHGSWLLIFDNVDDLTVLRALLPEGPGHCLITTRLPATYATISVTLGLDTFDKLDSTLFLLRRARLISSGTTLDAVSGADRANAEEIARDLGGLPLALDQAAAFIEETPSTLEEYKGFYRKEGARLRERHGEFSTEHLPVAKTFSLAFAGAEKRNCVSADLLRVAAFLAPDAIPEELFARGGAWLSEHIARVANQPLDLTEAFKEAARFSLIRRDHPAQRSFSIHRLVQEVIKDGMDFETRRHWLEHILRAVIQVFPSPTSDTRDECERYISHSLTLAESIQSFCIETVAAGELLDKAGSYLRLRGRYKDAGRLLRQGLEIREKLLGAEHRDTADTLYSLSAYSAEQQRHKEAELPLRRALIIREKALGPEHVDTVSALSALGVLMHRQGRHAEADLLLLRSITLTESVFGPTHSNLAVHLSNYARLLNDMGRNVEALQVNERANGIRDDDSKKRSNLIDLIQGSIFDEDLKLRLVEDLRRWGTIDAVSKDIKFHCVLALRQLANTTCIAMQLFRERRLTETGRQSEMEHFNSNAEGLLALKRGVVDGRFRDCSYLEVTPFAKADDFVIVCGNDSFITCRDPNVHSGGELICSKSCSAYHNRLDPPEDLSVA